MICSRDETEIFEGRSARRPSESIAHTPSGHTVTVKKSVKKEERHPCKDRERKAEISES